MATFETHDRTGNGDIEVRHIASSVTDETKDYADNYIQTSGLGIFLPDEDLDKMMVTMLTNAGVEAPACPVRVNSIQQAREYAKAFLLYAQRCHEHDREEMERNDERVRSYFQSVKGQRITTVLPAHREEYENASQFAQAGGFDIDD